MDKDSNVYCISWKTFDEHLATTFRTLLADGNFKDVTLVSDDQTQMTAHKSVLSASSPILASILINNPHSNPLLFMRGLKRKVFEKLLEFIYLGKADLDEKSLNDFMDIGRDLKINGLYKEDENESTKPPTKEINDEILNHELNIGTDDNDDEYLDIFEDLSEAQMLETTPYNTEQLPPSLESNMLKYSPNSDTIKEEDPDSKLQCNMCASRFTSHVGLSFHIKAKHLGIKYSCDRCDYKAGMSSNLKSHIETKHLGIRYSCDKCDYKATKPSHLKLHKEARHEGVTYDCNLCDFKSGWPQKLTAHKQRNHLNSKSQK